MATMNYTPEWALPLCPNCGSWGQGLSVEKVDAACRAGAAYVIAHRIRTQKETVDALNSLECNKDNPIPDTFPEPINWQLAATCDYGNDEMREWVKRQAIEYA
jgi:hypothetical protein